MRSPWRENAERFVSGGVARRSWGVARRSFQSLASANTPYIFARGLREAFGPRSWPPGTGTATTVSPSMPAKSFELHVYNGNPFARAVAAIMTS